MEEPIMEKNRFERLREQKGWSRSTLAEISGLKQTTIYSYERRGMTPRGDKLFRLAEALGVSPEYLLGAEAHPPKKQALPSVNQSLLGAIKDPRLAKRLQKFESLLDHLDLAKAIKLAEACQGLELSEPEVDGLLSYYLSTKLYK